MLRKSTAADLDRVHELISALVGHELDYDTFAQIYKEQLNDNDYYCLLGELDGRVCGVLNMRFDRQLHHGGNVAEVLEFFITPDVRSQGTGARMLEAAEAIAKEHQCVLIEVTSRNIRVDAHRFYMREGMEHTHAKFVKEF
ncbi:GNAT family N-acetyltransferase [Megasphaera hominis]|jgi:PhnO protein|uniref:GNAT family N-acetyltransferase n=1 Tax=Megasphaera hominis TaxID=159836 RepID=A0ABR6VHU2_9FIRM|nr:GNAT family N-acetyltransferase [Megasphaera hominis]MBC3536868.1 GNAT family N-acetyltransferase [Megasphaera hominis]